MLRRGHQLTKSAETAFLGIKKNLKKKNSEQFKQK